MLHSKKYAEECSKYEIKVLVSIRNDRKKVLSYTKRARKYHIEPPLLKNMLNQRQS